MAGLFTFTSFARNVLRGYNFFTFRLDAWPGILTQALLDFGDSWMHKNVQVSLAYFLSQVYYIVFIY